VHATGRGYVAPRRRTDDGAAARYDTEGGERGEQVVGEGLQVDAEKGEHRATITTLAAIRRGRRPRRYAAVGRKLSPAWRNRSTAEVGAILRFVSEQKQDTSGGGTRVAETLERRLALGSLARLARLRARREEGHRWPAMLVLGRWRWFKTHWRDRTYYLLGGFWVGLIFVPFPDPGFGPFQKSEDAEGFLRTLW
jgi:hypothetical protein